MTKIKEAKELLRDLDVPVQQQSDLCALVILALARLQPNDEWILSTNHWIRIHDILLFIKQAYGITYAENSRETIRKQAIHHFRNAAFIEDNGAPTNSPNYRYRLTEEMLSLLKSFQTMHWSSTKHSFLENHNSLINFYRSIKLMEKMPVKINGNELTFSPGKHNELQKLIIEEFAPRFAENATCL